MRTCIGCRKTRPPNALVRVAVAPDGVVADRRHRVGGRGAWECPDPACVRRGAKHLVRALRLPPLQVPAEDLLRLVTGESDSLGAHAGRQG